MIKLASITKRGKDWQAKVYYYDHDHIRHAKSKKDLQLNAKQLFGQPKKKMNLMSEIPLPIQKLLLMNTFGTGLNSLKK